MGLEPLSPEQIEKQREWREEKLKGIRRLLTGETGPVLTQSSTSPWEGQQSDPLQRQVSAVRVTSLTSSPSLSEQLPTLPEFEPINVSGLPLSAELL
jgi:hypothetical protein